MRMAMVGLGKMGGNMVRRLRRGGIDGVAHLGPRQRDDGDRALALHAHVRGGVTAH